MYATWHNGGLHVRPETDEEGRALLVVIDALSKARRSEPGNVNNGSGDNSAVERVLSGVVANH